MPSSIFSLKSLLLKFCASDEGPFNPTLTQGKECLVVVIVTARFLWILHGNMLPVYCPYSMGDIPCSSELLPNLLPVFRVSRAAKIFALEFSKDGSAVLGGGFTAEQPVILQGSVGFSCCQVSQHYCQFLSNF